MDFFDATGHLLNFLAPALGLGGLAAALAKLVYRREWAGRAWWPLALWSGLAAVAMQLGGLLVFGREGKMATYGAMVAACALTLWWRGFLAKKR